MDWGTKWLVYFNVGITNLVLLDRFNNTGAIDVKIDRSALEEKSPFKMLGLTLSSKLDWDSYIISISRAASKKFRYMKFRSPKAALYLCRCTKRPCTEYFCHAWDDAPSCYLESPDYLQKRIRRTFGSSLAASLEPMTHRRNVASLSYFGRCSSELAQVVPLPYSRGKSIHYSHRLHDFPATIPRCYKDVYVNSFFLPKLDSGIICLCNVSL